MSKEAVDRLRERAQNEQTFFALSRLCNLYEDTIASLKIQLAAKQATIDCLMLEYCPNEMTEEQMAEWARHQKKSALVDFTPHLRQYMHNDGSGLVFGYDKAGIDRELTFIQAKIYPQFETADDLIAWLDTLYSTEGGVITNQKWEPAQKVIALLQQCQATLDK